MPRDRSKLPAPVGSWAFGKFRREPDHGGFARGNFGKGKSRRLFNPNRSDKGKQPAMHGDVWIIMRYPAGGMLLAAITYPVAHRTSTGLTSSLPRNNLLGPVAMATFLTWVYRESRLPPVLMTHLRAARGARLCKRELAPERFRRRPRVSVPFEFRVRCASLRSPKVLEFHVLF